MRGHTGQTGLILDTSDDRDQTDSPTVQPGCPELLVRGGLHPITSSQSWGDERGCFDNSSKSEPSSSLESGSFQRPPKSKHSHLTSWEEGKKGDAKITFVGSINTPVCRLEIRPSPRDSGASFLWATGVVNDQHNIDAVGLQQVHKKTPVSLGV